jgi:hypothetical protein
MDITAFCKTGRTLVEEKLFPREHLGRSRLAHAAV